MSDDETTTQTQDLGEKKPAEGQVSLTQMLKALDKDVASGLEKRLKKLSKKKAVTAPLDEHKVAQLERREAYSETSKNISKWDPIVERNRASKQLSFPLDVQPDLLPTTADTLEEFHPRNDLEKEVQEIIEENKIQMQKQRELTRAEHSYQKAISAEEAKERHKEMQKMRVKLGTYAAKMRRQKTIKSKSYHKLLKRERIKKHVKRVESDQDALLDEIERLQKLRAQERASLKHKNTGKWAKHAKFRAKYDEKARNEMLEQIGIARKLLDKPVTQDTDDSENDEEERDYGDEDDDEETDEEEISDVSEGNSSGEEQDQAESAALSRAQEKSGPVVDRLVVSSELISEHAKRKRDSRGADENDDLDSVAGSGDNLEDEDEEDEQRRLMSEAFANDDVVGEFNKLKDQMADEEQPKDIDTYLPGWGDWAGPGVKINKRKRRKYIIKAKKVDRHDKELNHVIISEKANETIKDLQPKSLPRGIRNDNHLKNILTRPTTSTFTNQTAHREATRPRIETRMGQRIEPIGPNQLRGMMKADWS